MIFFFLVSFGFASACTNQVVSVRSFWSLPLTNVVGNEFCTYTFKIPQNYFAIVDSIQHINGNAHVTLTDDYNNNIPLNEPTASIALPGNFQIVVKTTAFSPLQIAVNVTVQKIARDMNILKFDTTQAPYFLNHVDEMVEGTSYQFYSNATGKVNLQTDFFAPSNPQIQNLENIFIYSGGSLVGTLHNVLTMNSLVSTNNELILYVAKKVADLDAIILVNDYSNVAQFNSHGISYITDSSTNWSGTILGSSTKEGCLTIIGPKNSNLTIGLVQRDDSLNGEVSTLPGAPLADHSKASPLSQSSLPIVLDGSVETIYVTKGVVSLIFCFDNQLCK